MASAAAKAGLLNSSVAGTAPADEQGAGRACILQQDHRRLRGSVALSRITLRRWLGRRSLHLAGDVDRIREGYPWCHAIEAQIQAQRAQRASQHNQQQLAAVRERQGVANATVGAATAATLRRRRPALATVLGCSAELHTLRPVRCQQLAADPRRCADRWCPSRPLASLPHTSAPSLTCSVLSTT